MLSLRTPGGQSLARVLDSQTRAELTYTEVGATAGKLPAGYRHDHHVTSLGHGQDAFKAARAGLEEWAPHRHAGVVLLPPQPDLSVGTTVVQHIRFGPINAIASCRIVYVVDDEDRSGFAYGTLPAHPEQGEEAFIVHRLPNDQVRFEITVFSRPRHPVARIGSPVARAVQLAVTRRYLEGLRAFVAANS